MQWLPETLREWASSSAFLPMALNEILTDRDTRLAGAPGISRTRTALAAVIQKLQERRAADTSAALVIAPSREAEESTLRAALALAAGTTLRTTGTAGLRDKTALAKAFAEPADLIVTSPKTAEKLFELGLLQPDSVKTVFVDDIEWHEAQDSLKTVIALCERLPAARQVIVTTLPGYDTLEGSLTELLHAPAFCRAQNDAAPTAQASERVILVPEDKVDEVIQAEAAQSPILFVCGSPTESTRLISVMKDAGLSPKRVTTAQSESARETLILKFAAERIDQIVMPHAFLSEFKNGTLRRLLHVELPGGPQAYLEHLSLLRPDGVLVTIVTPETLAMAEKLFAAAEKKLPLENPYALPDVREEIGLIVRREKLTIRADYSKTVPQADDIERDNQNALDDEPRERFRDEDGERRPKRRFEKKKPYAKKKKRFDERPPRQTMREDTGEQSADASAEKSGEEDRTKAVKPYRERRYPKKKRYDKARRDIDVTQPADAQPPLSPEGESPVPQASEGEAPHSKKPYKSFKDRRKFKKKPQPRQTQPVTEDTPLNASVPAAEAEGSAPEAARPERRPGKKRPFPGKKKPQAAKPRAERRDEWDDDDDNFGNSIHYKPRHQNLRTLRSDQPIHWEPNDPFHPSAQALSLPQLMPDEYAGRGTRDVDGNRAPRSFGHARKPGFKKRRGPNNR